jgi:hypothetical protein
VTPHNSIKPQTKSTCGSRGTGAGGAGEQERCLATAEHCKQHVVYLSSPSASGPPQAESRLSLTQQIGRSPCPTWGRTRRIGSVIAQQTPCCFQESAVRSRLPNKPPRRRCPAAPGVVRRRRPSKYRICLVVECRDVVPDVPTRTKFRAVKVSFTDCLILERCGLNCFPPFIVTWTWVTERGPVCPSLPVVAQSR